MILTESIFRIRCIVGDVPQPIMLVHAPDAAAADRCLVEHYAETHPGETFRILWLDELADLHSG